MARIAKTERTVEASFVELEKIIEQLGSEELSLEESFQVYQKGMKLLKNCNDSIDRVEKQLILVREGNLE